MITIFSQKRSVTVLVAVLALTDVARSQIICPFFGELDCQGEILITLMALNRETCLSWLDSPEYRSVLIDPDGENACINEPALPVELASFEATVVGDVVRLNWATASETDNAGFDIEHRITSNSFEPVGFVPGSGTTRLPQTYSFDVPRLEPNRHVFRLKQIDFDGTFRYSTEIEAQVTVPGRIRLEPAYPNPFNPRATVRFSVGVEQHVVATLTDAEGRQVGLLHDGVVPANETRSLTVDGARLSSGLYFVTVTGAAFTERVSVMLQK